jgi:hypothetical protein
MIRCYVAGAYSGSNVLDVLNNIRNGLRWSTKVVLDGMAPFVPWFDFHFQLMLRENENLTVQDYYNYSMEWLKVSDVVFVTPGWENSNGTKKEIAVATSLDIPVIYDYNELLSWKKNNETKNTVKNNSIDNWFNELNNPADLRTDYERGFRDGAFAAKLKIENNI